MNASRRFALLAVFIALVLGSSVLRAQALQQLPADALVVAKINNPQAVSEKFGAMAQRLGLANFVPQLADPITALKEQLNLRQGLDTKGEVVIALYDKGAADEDEPVLLLLPVTDYKAFLTNFPDAKQEGNISTVTLGADTAYATNVGTYAALTPIKSLLSRPRAGMPIEGQARKQIDSNDIAIYANIKLLSSKVLPQLREHRPQILDQMQQELSRTPTFDKRFLPVMKVLVSQMLNVAEATLRDGQSATFGLTLTKEGIRTTLLGEFAPQSEAGKAVASIRNSDASLVTGLPDQKYLAFGGATIDPAAAKLIIDLIEPISKELANVGDSAKAINTYLDAVKGFLTATNGVAFGYVPNPAIGQGGPFQQVGVYRGDAKKIAAEVDRGLQALQEFMKTVPQQQAPMTMNIARTPGAKTINGVKLDVVTMQFKVDRNTPEGAQMGQMLDMLYGPNGMTAYMGAIDDKTYFVAVGANDQLINNAITAAKQQANALAAAPHIKAVADQLPQNRIAVAYVAVDNIVALALQYAAQFGVPIRVKLPPNLPPIGLTFSTEGTALRGDSFISTDLIEALIAAGMQVMMQQQGGKPGAL